MDKLLKKGKTLRSVITIPVLLCLCFFVASCEKGTGNTELLPAASKTTLYLNGTILTMNDQQPVVEALAVSDGRILGVGTKAEMEQLTNGKVEIKDLMGHTLLPGFIDSHGHITNVISILSYSNVAPPPIGSVSNIADIQNIMRDKKSNTKPGEWLVGFGYDDSLLEEQRHPTREELDAVSTEHPILISHASGHLVSCNSACLELAGIDANTPDPSGGVIRRKPGSNEPDGVLEEAAAMAVYFPYVVPLLEEEQRLALLGSTQDYYAGFGITTIQDGATDPGNLKMLQEAAGKDLLKLDVVAFPVLLQGKWEGDEFGYSREYANHLRVGGAKLVLDGSPQGKTAWLTKPYYKPPPGRDIHYHGYSSMDNAMVEKAVNNLFAKGVPVIAHANGDAASDQLIEAVKKANQAHGYADRRTVIIHGQVMRNDQIDEMNAESIVPSYFVAHTYFWGDWHRDSVLGEERGARISPLASTQQRGVPYTIHNDSPIVPPDMMRLVWSAVNRITRSGKVLGEAERVSPLEALKAITIKGAYQYFEEDSKGSLEPGKLADMVILSKNPLEVDPLTIKDIKVLETIKEGVSVFQASN